MKSSLLLIICILSTFLKLHAQGGNPNITNREIVVRLNYKYLIREVIEDTNDQIFPVHHALNIPGIGLINSVGVGGLANFPMKKVFPYASWRDSISRTITGDRIAVPPFWATFVITVPNEKQYCSILKKMKKKTEIFDFAHENYPVERTSGPNDEFYNRQESLNGNATLPNAGINIEEAWAIETGEKFVKVAVLDSGIDTTVADLKVLFGGPYYNPENMGSGSFLGYGVDEEGHGTQVASIIGAKRNNTTGTAGIAGGNGADEEGVSLIDLRFPFNSNSGSKYICAATVDAARTVGTYWDYPNGGLDGYGENYYFDKTPGFGVNIQNNSFTIRTDIPICKQDKPTGNPNSVPTTGNVDEPNCVLCREAFLYSYKSGVINVVARGNSGALSEGQGVTFVEKLYPQNVPDEWIISVGASSYDGTTVRQGVNQGFWDATYDFYSLYGGNMDLIAPGSDSIVYTPLPTHFDEDYRWFHGTSAAAPHVTGVVALLLSHYNKDCYSNKNLAIEDVEYILQESATDIFASGFDEMSGAGRLNAGAALKMIENPTKQVVHPQNLLSSLEVERDTIVIKYDQAFVGSGWGPISNGFPLTRQRNYQVVRLKYENTYSFAEYITPTTQIIDYWARGSASNSLRKYTDTSSVTGAPWLGRIYTFDRFDMTPLDSIAVIDTIAKTIKTQGYYYHFIARFVSGSPNDNTFVIDPQPTNIWLPANPEIDTARMPVSLYINDPLQTSWFDYPCYADNLPWDSTYIPLNGINELENGSLKIYPNPTTSYVEIEFMNLTGIKQIQLLDMNGKVVKEFETNKDNYYLNVSDLTKGVYLLTCLNEKSIYHYKIVKE